MRKLIVSQFLTLDGIMESPEKWNSSYTGDEEMILDMVEGFAASDLLVLGRTTYEFFAARWPSRNGNLADWLNSVHKIVVSSTIKNATWNNSEIVNDLKEIEKLKTQQGKNILVLGSYQLVQDLMKENLVDGFKLYIYPMVLGTGKRLFEEKKAAQSLRLVTARIFGSGRIQATYSTNISLQNL